MEEENPTKNNFKEVIDNTDDNLKLEDIFQEYLSKKQLLIQQFYKEIE